MKKAAQLLALGFVGSLYAAFFVPVVFAQTAPAPLLLQSQYNTSVSNGGVDESNWIFTLTGYEGTITAGQMYVNFSPFTSGSSHWEIQVAPYPSGVPYCDMLFSAPNATTTSFTSVVATSQGGSGGCTLSGGEYTVNIFTGNSAFGSAVYTTFGALTNTVVGLEATTTGLWTNTGTVAVPYFVLQGSGFIASSSNSSLDLSGASMFCNAQFGTSSSIASDFGSALCTAVGFLFIPSQDSVQQFQNLVPTLEGVAPFSYFYGAYNIYSSYLTASSTENLPTFRMTLPALGSTTPLGVLYPTTFEFFSTTTISHFYPDSLRETFLTLGTWAIWVFTLYEIYRRIVPHKVITHH